jgi:hypothetical protein
LPDCTDPHRTAADRRGVERSVGRAGQSAASTAAGDDQDVEEGQGDARGLGTDATEVIVAVLPAWKNDSPKMVIACIIARSSLTFAVTDKY